MSHFLFHGKRFANLFVVVVYCTFSKDVIAISNNGVIQAKQFMLPGSSVVSYIGSPGSSMRIDKTLLTDYLICTDLNN